MDKNTSPATSRPARRSVVSTTFLLSLFVSAALAGSCGNSENEPGHLATGATTGEGTTPGSGGTLGDPSNGTGSPSGLGTGTPGGSSTTSGVPSVPAGSAGSGTPSLDPTSSGTPSNSDTVGPGGTSSAGGTDDGMAPEAQPCEDVLPPPDPEWPDATCESWANETEECGEPWFAGYCNLSCGRCVPEAGGMTPEPEPEPCEDILPPPDPEWPDATCEAWANETEECSAAWFAEYCDISCGRCVPEGGGMTPAAPEPEICEDVEPPPDPEWPGATCAEWARESDECNAAWFADYCDISCGRCIPEGGLPPEPSAPDCSGEGLPNVSGGEGFTTRYWDCCQPHCAQQTGHRCGQDGVSNTGNTQSACAGGGSFACYDEAPRAVSECLSYGHVAKANPNCGQCYRIQFTGEGEHNPNDPGSKLIKGKQMIVKVTNTGSDVAGNQFDLMIPGGGVGQFDACSQQWGTSDLGERYGGFLTACTGSHEAKKECVRQACMRIPAGSARDGCIWFVDWLQVADNPKFTSEPTNCPF